MVDLDRDAVHDSISSPVPDHGSDFTERRLLLLRSPRVRVLLLVAPAGYGKTTAANALRAEYRNSATCDCAEATDEKSFGRLILFALAQENSDRAPLFSSLQNEMAIAETSAQRSSILDTAWTQSGPDSVFVFENAEALAGQGPGFAMLTQLLITAPDSRRVVVCSRWGIPVRASRYLPPHRILTLTTSHFALDAAEAAALLEAHGVEEQYRAKIIAEARGWPVVLLLLARLAAEGRLETALSNAADVAFEDLFTYFLHEVLAPLEPRMKYLMTLVSAVPEVTAEELRAVTGLSEIDLELSIHHALLITREGTTYSIHPLLRKLLLENEPEWRTLLEPFARFAEEHGKCTRAAALYRLMGNPHAAAQALSRLSVVDLQTPSAEMELQQLPIEVVYKYANLLVACQKTSLIAITPEIAQERFESLSHGDDPEAILHIAQIHKSENCTTLADQLMVFETPVVQNAARQSETAAVLFELIRCYTLWYFGACKSIEEPLRRTYERLHHEEHPDAVHAAALLAATSLQRGNRASCLHWNTVTMLHARKRSPRTYAAWLVQGIYCPWFFGDEATYEEYHRQLEDAEAATGAFLQVSRLLNPDTVESQLPSPAQARHITAMMHAVLAIAISKATDERRHELVTVLRRYIDPNVLGRVEARLSIAACEPELKKTMCDELFAIVDPVEMPEYCQAIQAYADCRPSFLDTFLGKFQTAPTRSLPTSNEVRLELLRERVLIGGEGVRLTPREAGVLAFLSRRRSGSPREEIQDAIWPDLDEISARDALYSLLHRLRKRTSKAPLVDSIGNGYRISSSVQVDLWDIESLGWEVEREHADGLFQKAYDAHEHINQRATAHLQQFEWFAPIEFRLQETARRLALYLIKDAERRQDQAAILRYANALIDEDPCDEWAQQLRIRMYLGNNDRAQARHAYRAYCSMLQQDIGATPSREMQHMARAANLL